MYIHHTHNPMSPYQHSVPSATRQNQTTPLHFVQMEHSFQEGGNFGKEVEERRENEGLYRHPTQSDLVVTIPRFSTQLCVSHPVFN